MQYKLLTLATAGMVTLALSTVVLAKPAKLAKKYNAGNYTTGLTLFQPGINESSIDRTANLANQQRFNHQKVTVALDPTLAKKSDVKVAYQQAINNWNSANAGIKLTNVKYRNNADIVITPVIIANHAVGYDHTLRVQRFTRPNHDTEIHRSLIEFDYENTIKQGRQFSYTQQNYLNQMMTHAMGEALGLGQNFDNANTSVMSPEAVGQFNEHDLGMLQSLYSHQGRVADGR